MFCAAIKLIVVEVSVFCCHQVDSGGGVLCCHQVDSGGGVLCCHQVGTGGGKCFVLPSS